MGKRAAQARETTIARGPAAVRKHVPREERRQKDVDTAVELYCERGFVGTSTRLIAAAVGNSETVLFRLFASKECLSAAILAHCAPAAEVECWLEELRTLADRRDDAALFSAVV